MTTEARRDGSVQEQSNNSLGTFAFNSLADLQVGQAVAVFATARIQRAGCESVRRRIFRSAIRGERPTIFRSSTEFALDANQFLESPACESRLGDGVRREERCVPNKFYLSPRVGFSWTYGTAPQIAGFEGACRGPRAVVRGGIGVFQNTPNANLVGTALDNTGLASARAAAHMRWCGDSDSRLERLRATIRRRFRRSALTARTGTVFSSSAPNVSLFAKDYQAPRSVRSNLQWNGPILGNRFTATVEGTYSLNLNQQGTLDLNFNPYAAFTLAGRGRPAGICAADEHCSDHRRDCIAGCARVAAVLA